MANTVKCWLGWHDWWYEYDFGTKRRKCMRCLRWQALIDTWTSELIGRGEPTRCQEWRWL